MFSKVKKEIWLYNLELDRCLRQIIVSCPKLQALKLTKCSTYSLDKEFEFDDEYDPFDEYNESDSDDIEECLKHSLSRIWLDNCIEEQTDFNAFLKWAGRSRLGEKLSQIVVRNRKMLDVLKSTADMYLHGSVQKASHYQLKYNLRQDLSNFGLEIG